MRIEVLIGSEDPIIFPLNATKLVLGSGENCDIIVSGSGISRKHLTITTENDQYFVTDMGSTNGSFINEERLVPGRKVEFTSFFPVRLGDNTLVSLLSDEEDLSGFSIPVPRESTSPSIKAPPKGSDDSTTVINLRDLRNVRTENLVLERNKKREIRKKTQKKVPETKPKKKPNYVGWFVFLIIAGAAYYNFFVQEHIVTEEKIQEVGRIVEAAPSEAPKPKKNLDLVDESDLTDKDKFHSYKNNMKCTIDKEKYLCDVIPGVNREGFGVTQVGLTLYVFVDATHYYINAKNYVSNKSDTELIAKTAAFIFVTKDLPPLDEALIEDSRILVGLYRNTESGMVLENIVAFKAPSINKNREQLSPNQLQFIRSIGNSAIKFTEDVYTVY